MTMTTTELLVVTIELALLPLFCLAIHYTLTDLFNWLEGRGK